MPHDRPIHVCIVGAGVSGLRCADILLSHGFQVTVLEARDRIGGRICQSRELGGANWIHTWDSGQVHPIWKLATETKTPVHHWNSKQMLFDSTGNKLPDETTDRLSTLLWKIIEEAFEYSAKAHEGHQQPIPANDSLYDYIQRRCPEEMADEQERDTLLQMSEMWGAYVGEPVWMQSLKFAWMEECCGGEEEMFVASTYSAILDRISKAAREGAEIVLKKRVVSVETSERVSDKRVRVITDDGSIQIFDEVSTVIAQIVFGHRQSKAFTTRESVHHFPSAFWLSDKTADTFPSFTNWLRPKYANDTNPHHWPQEIWNLAAFAPPNNHPTMLFYLYGDCSRFVVNSIYGKPRQEKHDFLNNFFLPYYSRLPGYDSNDPHCTPKAILATEWLKDELNGHGSYCNFQAGIKEADKDVGAFREGCVDQRLWFCGEHAAPFEECGTVAGAYLSGEFAGKNIVELYDREP
ncbi:hypothetical protein D9757_014105 [Collybiopsis confluens]|uniref:Amine oxidase domain-containing protein n=1 Tax=Collybiopsis confluens TaxID=2823264 RepID=A0A8H5FPG1_9AGAR|nr:hypothetical protein D9757_014105 [Collybiopsis confluens]